MFDFDKKIDRFHTGSYKWDIRENELPMWVADMDFEAAPCILEALNKRVSHGVFGYNVVPEEYFDSIIDWWDTYHHFKMEKDALMFCTGVVPAISSVVRKVTSVGENVLIMSPVYNIFYNSIINNGRNIVSSDLVYENGEYHIDFEDLEKKLSNPQTSLMIFCNPHNPIGKIWDKETLIRVGKLCDQYKVIVLSDEIHCDITHPDREYIPYASVNEVNKQQSITCIAPTKCFNIAGLQTSCIAVFNPFLRHKVWRGINTDEVAEPNSFAVEVSIAAFRQGRSWLEELKKYIQKNKDFVVKYIEDNLPQLHVVPSMATYLLWIECSRVSKDSVVLTEFIREKTGLYVSEGLEYGQNGKTFIRMNVATPFENVRDGMERLERGIRLFTQA